MGSVTLRNINKRFKETAVLSDVSLEIADREFMVLVGPSGCGKSTLLRILAGLEEATSGAVEIGGREVTALAPREREIAMVFQDYALYPHMTVEENMSFGLRLRGMPKREIEARVAEAAGMLQIAPLLKRRPSQLSGGQRQRVAIGRAIVRKPQVFLFDEPLSNLDAKLREETRVELAKLHQRLPTTIVYVTHDQVEAMTLASRIAVLNAGRIQQAGAPEELYLKPANLFVAGFIGSPAMNFARGTIEKRDGGFSFVSDSLRIPLGSGVRPGAAVLGARPDDTVVAGPGVHPIAATIEVVEHLGARKNVHLRAGPAKFLAVVDAGFQGKPSEQASLSFHSDRLHLFDAESGVRLVR